MNTITYDKTYFLNMSEVQLNKWIARHNTELSCASLFTYTDKGICPIIKNLTKKYAHNGDDFVPTHVGNIIRIGTQIFVFNMIPPKSKTTLLIDYIKNADFDYRIVTFADNNFNGYQYTVDTLKYNNRRYGYFSALQSGIKPLRWIPNRKAHCSEIFIKMLQRQGYYKEIKADDVTPVEAHNLLAYGSLR